MEFLRIIEYDKTNIFETCYAFFIEVMEDIDLGS